MFRFKNLFVLIGILLISALPAAADAMPSVKGEMTLGCSAGYASRNDGAYANLFFQYTFIPHLRLSADVGYVFRNQDKSAFELSLDMHAPFRVARGLQIYPLVGFTFNAWNYRYSDNLNRFGGDFGAGIELYLTNSLKLSLQGKYSLMKDTGGAFAGLGIGYIF